MKKRTAAKKLVSPQREREIRAAEITQTKLALDALRDEMLQNNSTWKYEQMQQALQKAGELNKELKRLMK